MSKLGTIYKIENRVNGKVYIGQTTLCPNARQSAHMSQLRRRKHPNAYLQNAWNKHGGESFEFTVIRECEVSDLDDAEIRLIGKYKRVGKCYNLESGGNKNKKLHESTKKKLSKINKHKHKYDAGFRQKYLESRAKQTICINTGQVFGSISEASEKTGIPYQNIHQVCLGNNRFTTGADGEFYQFAYYEEGKTYKLRDIDVRDLKFAEKVICVNTQKTYPSMHQASSETGVSQSKISMCCNGKRKHAGRLANGDWMVWRFLEEYDPNEKISFKRRTHHSKETREKMSKSNTGKIKDRIYSATDPETETSVILKNRQEALSYLEMMGVVKPNIYNVHNCCSGRLKTAYGLVWRCAQEGGGR